MATTWECNLRCAYCFVRDAVTQRGARMSPKLAARVVDALDGGLPDVEAICVHLYGGEPLTNLPAMEALLEHSDARAPGRFSFAITTNGTILDEAVFDLLEAGRFSVVLSIDGPAPVHDACRCAADGSPTHARVLEFLHTVRSRTRCEVRGSSVVRAGWSLAEATAYLRSLPVHAIKAQAVRAAQGSPFALSPGDTRAYLRDLEAVGRQVIDDLEHGRVPRDDRFSSRVLQLLAGQRRDAFCGAGDTTFGITPTGHVVPCVLMDPAGCVLGHVGDPRHGWVEQGRRWREARPVRPECQVCSALDLCGGGCPAMMPVCGADECDLTRKNCEVAAAIYEHFADTPETLLTLAGIT